MKISSAALALLLACAAFPEAALSRERHASFLGITEPGFKTMVLCEQKKFYFYGAKWYSGTWNETQMTSTEFVETYNGPISSLNSEVVRAVDEWIGEVCNE